MSAPLASPASHARARDADRLERLRERLTIPDALLSRTDLAELGLGRRAVDAVFRELDVVVLPGFSRPFVRVADYLELLERSRYTEGRVRGSVQTSVQTSSAQTRFTPGRFGADEGYSGLGGAA